MWVYWLQWVPCGYMSRLVSVSEGMDSVPSREDITRILQDISRGRAGAENALLPLVYDELRSLAHHYMRDERQGHTLQTTALVHEAYLKLGGTKEECWESKAHYLRVAAKAMRRVLIDHARHKRTAKKGHGREREPHPNHVDRTRRE